MAHGLKEDDGKPLVGGGEDKERGLGEKRVQGLAGEFAGHLNAVARSELPEVAGVGCGDVAVACNDKADASAGQS